MNEIERKRATNLWEPFVRKFPPVAKSCELTPTPAIGFGDIGGLEEACAGDRIKRFCPLHRSRESAWLGYISRG
jgi:hypothetical protein